MDSALLVASLGILGGFILGQSLTAHHYEKQLEEIHVQYRASVEQARKKEEEWKKASDDLAKEYQDKLNAVDRDNSELVGRLQHKLKEYSSRMSKCPASSSRTDGSSSRASVAKELGELVEFSRKCSKRADEMTLQIQGLQKYYKSIR